MINFKKAAVQKIIGSIILFSSIIPLNLLGQETISLNYDRDTLISAARKVMTTTRFCALITLDESGMPNARTMDPFAPEEDMIVWLGTNSKSKKVGEIKNDPRVTLYYEAPNGSGYVVITGKAVLVEDDELKSKYWKDGWDQYYSDREDGFILIKVVPEKLKIIDYVHGILGDPLTWDAPFVKFSTGK